MIPSIGRIVHYTLSAQDAADINRRRSDARYSSVASHSAGVVVHTGNPATEGDKFPMVITRVWGDTENSAVNGQVMLDGNDLLWVTSRNQAGDEFPPGTPGRWFEPPRVRHTPPAVRSLPEEDHE